MSKPEIGLHADRVQSAIRSGEAASSALVASWQRSASLHRLDPAERRLPNRLSDRELTAVRQRMEPLLRAAQASLNRLYFAVGGMGCCVLLADRDGIPVERRGAVGDDETFEDWGLWTGCVWSEESEGTNGIGTCLVEQRVLTIHRQQHFFTRNTALSCTTAPIYDHEGRLAAALDVSSCRNDQTEDLSNLVAMAVTDATRRIEAENFRLAFPDARIVVAPTPEWSPSALLAVDKDDIVVGATRAARQAYRHREALIGQPLPLGDVAGEARFGDELRHAERAILERALQRSGGNVTAAARQLGVSRATLHRKLGKLGLERPH
ncbi:helix-turn-helix domain-containing protein [Kaistia nematophila]|uniref:GAF domain-containing protein n=1 Tax=Kaistia nematophila TaxID=2994654 RepID=A0A9X3IMZ6_9HYPH|nr:helix-turn-helix domain-containing protein [Kaistia nematophila]MCX5571412.1 GAF domain-containing protein [Kaistia nematophila]